MITDDDRVTDREVELDEEDPLDTFQGKHVADTAAMPHILLTHKSK